MTGPSGTATEFAGTLRSNSLAELLALLDAPDWSMRREVIAALASLGEPAVVALCRSLERERQNETRIAATVDTLVASAGDVESAMIASAASAEPPFAADVAQVL